ncbi:MAG TPA: tripartite tricarboxylate transporter substrate binding protein, partial [Burkholderiales bacterium]|nr:tripartite tricarboxylate transporter substrate binding protein [Burkholderiales bacterium]
QGGNMRLLRKGVIATAIAATLAPAAHAQPYPTKPVRMVVPFAPGGGVDATARVLSQRFTEMWHQQVIPDNRPGAGANIGAEIAAHAAPDGYTLLVTNNAIAISAGLYEKLGYNALRDLRPISEVLRTPFVLVVSVKSPARTVGDLVKMAKAKPGEVALANTGIGSGPHLAGVLFAMVTKTELNHIPYKGGGPAMQDLAAGRVNALFTTTLAAMPHVQAGRLRALGVTSPARWPALPDMPTISESGVPGYDVMTWYMLLAPARTPASIVAKLQADTATAVRHPLAEKVLGGEGGELVGGSSVDAAAVLKRETALWTKVIKEAGIKPGD